MRTRICHCICLSLICLAASLPALGSYGIYVGRNLTADGSTFLGGSGDEVSSHWLEIVPAADHEPGSTIRVGVDASAFLPGEFIEIPQVAHTYRYITMNYSEYEGFPPPLTNGGLNENGVAARDIWMDSRPELVAMTPRPQHGPNYSDLARIVMERAHSAEEAARLVGDLIDRYGYSSYGGNSHMFADAKEGWVLLDFAGGKGLWIARRLGPDEVVMFYPGYMGDIPLDFQDDPDYMGSSNFISFAVEQGWYDPKSGKPFNVTEVYGTPYVRSPRRELETELHDTAPITLRRMLDTVRDPRMSKDATGYGQVAHLRPDTPADLQTLWVAPTGSVTAPFIPWRMGVQSVPPEYGKHRYLTKGTSRGYLTRDWQLQEATLFAGRLFKRLMYFTCDRPREFLPEVTATLTAFENRMLDETSWVEESAGVLDGAGRSDLAHAMLTRYTHDRAAEALQLGSDLLAGIEARTRMLYGIRKPQGDEMTKLDYQMITCKEEQ